MKDHPYTAPRHLWVRNQPATEDRSNVRRPPGSDNQPRSGDSPPAPAPVSATTIHFERIHRNLRPPRRRVRRTSGSHHRPSSDSSDFVRRPPRPISPPRPVATNIYFEGIHPNLRTSQSHQTGAISNRGGCLHHEPPRAHETRGPSRSRVSNPSGSSARSHLHTSSVTRHAVGSNRRSHVRHQGCHSGHRHGISSLCHHLFHHHHARD